MDINIQTLQSDIQHYLQGEITTEQREKIANWMLTAALNAKGYNNFQSFEISGEQFFFDNVLSEMNPKVCVDVGANVGDYTKKLLVSTQAKIFAFEPLVKPFDDLKIIQSEFRDRLIVENKGVGTTNEVLEIYFNNDVTAHASFSKEVQVVPYLKNVQTTKVDVVSLDSYFSDKSGINVDFLKIDTEGFEAEVLLGAKSLIRSHKPKAIQMEFNWHQLFRGHTLYLFCQMLPDYSPFQMLPRELIKRDPKDPYANIYQFSNFVFLRNSFFQNAFLKLKKSFN